MYHLVAHQATDSFEQKKKVQRRTSLSCHMSPFQPNCILLVIAESSMIPNVKNEKQYPYQSQDMHHLVAHQATDSFEQKKKVQRRTPLSCHISSRSTPLHPISHCRDFHDPQRKKRKTVPLPISRYVPLGCSPNGFVWAKRESVATYTSGDFKGGPEGAMAPPDFWLVTRLAPPSFNKLM